MKDIRQWLNKLTRTCQCCAQGKDAARPVPKRRCCAVGKCCRETLSPQSRKDARATLRAALTCAVEEEIITRNPVGVIRLPAPRKSKGRVWTVDEARRFLESARHDRDPLYAAYVLILVLGLRKGEALGLTWDRVDLDAAELYVGEQLQRVKGPLIRRPVKTESSEAPLPLPALCVTALKLRHERQAADREQAAGTWIETGLVFTTCHGTPVEPRNFDRSFERRITTAAVPEDHQPQHPQDMRVTAGSPRRASARGQADPSAQPIRDHDGDLHRGTLGGYPRGAQEARAAARGDKSMSVVAALAAALTGK